MPDTEFLPQTMNQLADAQSRAVKAEGVLKGVEEELAEAKRAYSVLVRTLRDRWDRAHYDHVMALGDVLAAASQLNEMIR